MNHHRMARKERAVTALKFDPEHFCRRVLQDALAEATGQYWRRRARALEQALSRPGDYCGQATPDQIAERDEQLRAAILACTSHAQLYARGDDVSPEVYAVLREVA